MKGSEAGEFKDTPVGRVPSEWNLSKLGDVLILIRNGLTLEQNKEGKGYPISRIETISNEKIDFKKVGFVSNIGDEKLSEYKLIVGDILFSHINSLEHIGKAAIYKGEPNILLHGMNLLLLRANKDKLDSDFLFYLFKQYRVKNYFRNISKQAVNQASINQNELKKVKIPLPPLPEQRKIAEILSTVDSAIERTDRSIERTERLKRGLMHELLTHGIGHSEFKETPVGRVPSEWGVVKLGDVSLDFVGGGTPSTKNPTYWGGNIPWMTSAHINGRIISTGQKYITEKGVEESATNVVPKGNLLVATRVGIGKVALNLIDVAISQDLTGIIIDKSKAIQEYLYWTLLKNEGRIKPLAQGSTIKGVLRSDLSRLKIPLPPLPEQQKIATILSTVDTKAELEHSRKERLERIKRGLMDELLTGRRRVLLET